MSATLNGSEPKLAAVFCSDRAGKVCGSLRDAGLLLVPPVAAGGVEVSVDVDEGAAGSTGPMSVDSSLRRLISHCDRKASKSFSEEN